MITLDGSESGGQTIRSALSLSAITGKPFKITNIRGARPNPGLQPQHLTIVNALKEICNANVKGNQLHSKEIEFIPNNIKEQKFSFDIGTAGSTTLLLQSILPIFIYKKISAKLEIKGGTDTLWCPPAYDIKNVFLYTLEKFGINTDFEIEKHGFYPKGGGKIILETKQSKPLPIDLIERGNLKEVYALATATKDLEKAKVTERILKSFVQALPKEYRLRKEEEYIDSLSTGCFLHSYAEYENSRIGYTIIGEKGKPAEDIGKECAKYLFEEISSGATIDHFTADQVIIYLALFGGRIKTSKITDHMKTNIEVIKKFLNVKFNINNNIIECFP